jgi:hypothetical protein
LPYQPLFIKEYTMPYPKDNAKMTGDTHLPDVESDMSFEESSGDPVWTDETPRDRGEATERGDQKRPDRGASKAGTTKGRKAKASGESSGRG